MKTLLTLTLLLGNLMVLSQNISLDSGTTRAVVIGISDYQDEDIPDLQFAHRDAQIFAGWLNSTGGGSIAEVNLKVLMNEEATSGNIIEQMGWLIEQSKAGDKVIFYFSGHGDVESITSFQRGYLLTHNSPSRSYIAGAIPLGFLQDVTTTLTQNQVEVILITDACRSGKLAGDDIKGAQYTGAQLAELFSNELKILSCQPEEFSHEGAQGGDGHGAFTYNLVAGLTGLADRNEDFLITLSEIDRYLEDQVTAQVAPLQQTPFTKGNRNARIAPVDKQLLANWKEKKAFEIPAFLAVGNRNALVVNFESMDSSIQSLYFAFQNSLEHKDFFEPIETCAETYFQELIQIETLTPFHGAFRRAYAAALQDDAQNVLNALMKLDIHKIDQSRLVLNKKYSEYPKYLKRAAELLGTQHYFYKNLKARQFFFEGMLIWMEHFFGESKRDLVLEKYRKSLEYEAHAPHTHLHMSLCFATMFEEPDSMTFHAMKAAEQAPTWILPYAYLAYYKSQKFQQFDEAKLLIDKAIEMDSQNVIVMNSLATWHFFQKQYEPVVEITEQVVKMDSTYAIAWYNLGIGYYFTQRYGECQKALLKSLELDSNQFITYLALGTLYYDAQLYDRAEKVLLKSIELNPRHLNGYIKLGAVYYQMDKMKDSETYFKKAYDLKPTDLDVCINLAIVSTRLGKTEAALDYLEAGLKNGERDYNYIVTDTDFAPLRATARFKSLMQSYFPDKTKK
ncbi:MAG: caspase family protein [Saprospiraceae bacterium]|nr:caspase family protein [Saprospiraceae bacterium]